MKNIIFFFLFSSPFFLCAQYSTQNGRASFYSVTAKKAIEAHANDLAIQLDEDSGNINMHMKPAHFDFSIPLMGEHFRNYYLETDKYPNATFEGIITNIYTVNFHKNGSYPIQAEGKLTIHGETKYVSVNGTLEVKNEAIHLQGFLPIKLTDYKILVNSFVKDSVAEIVRVEIDAICKKGRKHSK